MSLPAAYRPAVRRPAATGLSAWARRHALFGAVLAAAIGLRVLAAVAYPSMLWTGDSAVYVRAALRSAPAANHPGGYPVFLWLLRPFHDFAAVVAAQAVLGLLPGVMVYALVWRAARARWPDRPWPPRLAGCAAAAPVLFDGDRLQLEHLLVSDELFGVLVLAAVTALLWRWPVTWRSAGLAGLLTGCAAVTRTAGLPLLAVLVAGIVLLGAGDGRRPDAGGGWRPSAGGRWRRLDAGGWWRRPGAGGGRRRMAAALAAAVAAFGVPVAGYMAWFHSHYGVFGFNLHGAVWLYGRTAAFADCARIRPAPDLAVLCPKRPPSDRRIASPVYAAMFSEESPFHRVGGIYGPRANELARRFAAAALRAQPGDYLRVVARDSLRPFLPGGPPYPTTWTAAKYRFPSDAARALNTADAVGHPGLAAAYGGASGRTRVVEPYARWVRGYQDRVRLPGPALGVLLLIGPIALVARRRMPYRYGQERTPYLYEPYAGERGYRGAVLTGWLTAVALLVIPAATADYDPRYVLPVIPLACLSAAPALLGRSPADRPAVPERP